MNPIIAIEGLSFAGKTTLIKLLETEGFTRLYELAEKFEYGAGFPPFPKTTDDAKKSDLWFVQQEVIREQDAQLKATSAPVLEDRSFISGLAFGYARQDVFGSGDALYQHGVIRQVVEQGKLHVPWLVHLKIKIDSLYDRKGKDEERRIREYGEAAVCNASVSKEERKFFEKQIEFYVRLFARVPHLELDALESPSSLASQVRQWSKGLKSQFSPVSIEDLFVKPVSVETWTP